MTKLNQTAFKKGRPKTGGRKKNTPNKTTVVKKARIAAAVKRVEELVADVGVTPEQAVKIVEKETVELKRGKDILSQFANTLVGMAAYYQPTPLNTNPNADEKKFLIYTELTLQFSKEAAPFETPRLGAMMVGQVQTKRIEVVGGLPSPGAPLPQLPPDMYDDSEPDDDKRNDDGHAQRDAPDQAPGVPPRAAKMPASE